MKIRGYVFLGALLALLFISVVAANEPTENDIKPDGANEVGDDKYYDGGGYGGWGDGWGGRGGGGGWGEGGGGWGGGCRCCRRYGGCRCCYTAQEALAYMQN